MGATGLMKVVGAIAFLALFATTLYPAAGVPAFDNITFPTLSNPFDAYRGTYTVYPIADGWAGTIGGTPETAADAAGTVAGCVNATEPTENYWGCVATEDGALSYATSGDYVNHPDHTQFAVNMSDIVGLDADFPVFSVFIRLQCRVTDANPVTTRVEIDFFSEGSSVDLFSFVGDITCKPGAFVTVTKLQEYDTPYPTVTKFVRAQALINPAYNVSLGMGNVSFSFLSATITYGSQAQCDSTGGLAYIGCVIYGFFVFLFKAAVLFVNLVIFGLGWLFAFLVFMADLFLILAWFYAIPGMPLFVQGFIDIIMSSLIAYLGFEAVKLVRGTEG